MTTLELKDAKTVPDPVHTYPKSVRNATPLVIDNGECIDSEIVLQIFIFGYEIIIFFMYFLRVISVSSRLGNAERTFAYIQEFNCKTKEGTWQKGNGIGAEM